MKKKFAVAVAVVLSIMSMCQSAGAINVILNSSLVSFPDQEPVLENGTTLVPIRPIAEALGLEVGWDDPTDTVTLKKDNYFIELVIGSTKAKTSEGVKTLSEAPRIINSRTMVPLRFVAEEFNLTVKWNAEYARVVIVGEIDTETVRKPQNEAVENSTEVKETVKTDNVAKTETEEDVIETETEAEENFETVVIDARTASITLEISELFYFEDYSDEEGFGYRALDATDFQHLYNWDKVTRCESYADGDKTNGIVFVVREFDPYEGEEYDISDMNREYPVAPQRPERPHMPQIDYELFGAEYKKVLIKQMFTDLGVELPENFDELSDDEALELLNLDEEAAQEQMQISSENADFSEVPGYAEYQDYLDQNAVYVEEMNAYNEEFTEYYKEYSALASVKQYAARHFTALADKATNEQWTKLFDELLNTDIEVRYDNVEIVEFDKKKIVHAVLYAEDPDDEQGVFEFYYYPDGDVAVTILGGTLYAEEASEDAADILNRMTIK